MNLKHTPASRRRGSAESILLGATLLCIIGVIGGMYLMTPSSLRGSRGFATAGTPEVASRPDDKPYRDGSVRTERVEDYVDDAFIEEPEDSPEEESEDAPPSDSTLPAPTPPLDLPLAPLTQPLGANAYPLRTWTSVKGKSIEGRFIKLDDNADVVLLANGVEKPVPFNGLSQADRLYVADAMAWRDIYGDEMGAQQENE